MDEGIPKHKRRSASVRVTELRTGYPPAGNKTNATAVLENVTFDVSPGEFVSVLGISGSGKTTLLHSIAGFLDTWNGQVVVDGSTVAGPSEDVGVIFQKDALFPWKTVFGNIVSGHRLQRLSRAKQRALAQRLADRVHMGEHLDQYPHELSGGMAQRTEIARALANEPSLLLLDEPFGRLDVQTRHSLQFFLQDLTSELGLTTVAVTHDVEEALILADRIFLLSGQPATLGKIVVNDLSRPRTLDHVTGARFNELQADILRFLEREHALLHNLDR